MYKRQIHEGRGATLTARSTATKRNATQCSALQQGGEGREIPRELVVDEQPVLYLFIGCLCSISRRLPFVWCGMLLYGMVRYGMVWYGMVGYGIAWNGMVWHGMAWHGMVWYGMVWYGIATLKSYGRMLT